MRRDLGRLGAKARLSKLSKRERKSIARKASKVAAIRRSKAAAARAQLKSPAARLSALLPADCTKKPQAFSRCGRRGSKRRRGPGGGRLIQVVELVESEMPSLEGTLRVLLK
jgi:hypothetical protein